MTAKIGAAEVEGWVTRDEPSGRWAEVDADRKIRPRSVRVGRLEAQATPADGGDERGVTGVIPQLAAYPTQMHVDGLRRGPEVGVPHLAHQLVAGHDLTRARDQRVNKIEFFARQRDLAGAAPHAAIHGIEFDVLDCVHGDNRRKIAAISWRNEQTRGTFWPHMAANNRFQPRVRTVTGSITPKPRTGRAGIRRNENRSTGSRSAVA